ncbi:MAG: hypothetical protein ABR557_02680 [Pyrinomonadaceae bacterium]
MKPKIVGLILLVAGVIALTMSGQSQKTKPSERRPTRNLATKSLRQAAPIA